jgi:hypothetical protein
MHGTGIRANKGVDLAAQGGQGGQVGLSRQIQHRLGTGQGHNSIGERLFAGASRHHQARPKLAAQVPDPLRKNGQGPPFQSDRWPLERVKSQ